MATTGNKRFQFRSPAGRLLAILWKHVGGAAPNHSWRRVNMTMRRGLKLAIDGGLRFARGDLARIVEAFNGDHWIGETAEWIYSLAVDAANSSAVAAFETWKGREPFIVDLCGTFVNSPSARRRLTVGERFWWPSRARRVADGQKQIRYELLTVTSFARDQESLVACSHHERLTDPRTGCLVGRERVKNRYRITRADIRDERKRRRRDHNHTKGQSK